MHYSKAFIRFNWLTVVLIFLVVIAGSFVRITGSGMGCPDWPKCFGQWIPPTDSAELPEDYKEVFLEKRVKKIKKFTSVLTLFSLDEYAQSINEDPNLLKEQPFNVFKTWTEYINRLAGFLTGNAILLVFCWVMLFYRTKKLVILSFVNLIFLVFQAWFGSIVVASNLVPWTISIHLFLALLIIGIQLYITFLTSPSQQERLVFPKWIKLLIWVCFIITVYQMFLGTQVREYIDELTKQGYDRTDWTSRLGISFFIHRSFSWLVLALLTLLAFFNEKNLKYKPVRWMYVLLTVELISGVLLAHADLPGLARTAHLFFASCVFGILTMVVFRLKKVAA